MGFLIPGYASLTFSPGRAGPGWPDARTACRSAGLAFERRACWPGLAVACRTRGECRKLVMRNRVTITLGRNSFAAGSALSSTRLPGDGCSKLLRCRLGGLGCWRHVHVEGEGFGVGVVVAGIAFQGEGDGGQVFALSVLASGGAAAVDVQGRPAVVASCRLPRRRTGRLSARSSPDRPIASAVQQGYSRSHGRSWPLPCQFRAASWREATTLPWAEVAVSPGQSSSGVIAVTFAVTAPPVVSRVMSTTTQVSLSRTTPGPQGAPATEDRKRCGSLIFRSRLYAQASTVPEARSGHLESAIDPLTYCPEFS